MALAGADTVTLDPAAVATARTALALTGAYEVREADYGNAEVEQYLSERKFGELPVGHRLPNRTVEYALRIQASGTVGVGAALRSLQRKVALFQDEGGWLGRTLSPRSAGEYGTDVLYADVVDAALALPADWTAQRQEVFLDARLTLTTLPDFYGAEVAAGSTNSTSPHDSISLLGTISGDYPARSRYTVTDTGSVTRQTVLIGSQARTYDSAATAALAYEAEALTAIDSAAAAAVSGALGGTAVRSTTISPTWTGILSTTITASGAMTHWGNYRILARCYASADAEVRIEYSVGDSTVRRQNASAAIPGSSMFYLRDLGEVRLPKAPVGTHRWEGRIHARSDTSGVTVGVDKVWIVPAESLSIVTGRRDPGFYYTPDTFHSRDTFSQTAGAATGKSLDVGGTWAAAGDTTDYNVSGSGVMTRTAVSDSGGTASPGRWLVPSAAAISDTFVSCEFEFTSWASSVPGGQYFGLAARYTSTTAYLKLSFDPAGEATGRWGGYFYVYTRNGGAEVQLPGYGYLIPSPGVRYVMALYAGSNGVWKAWLCPKAKRLPRKPSISGYSSLLDTNASGALATGKPAIYDERIDATACTRTFDNFYCYSPPLDAAVNSQKILSARHDGAWRETTSAGIYAPALITGNLPRDPVAGVEARTGRTLIVPSVGDFDQEPDTRAGVFSVQRHYRPTYLFVPEA